MVNTEPRNIDWATAEIEEGTLTVEFTGASSKAWKKRFESVLALLESSHSHWGEVRIRRKGVHVADVDQGAESELRHFLESIVLQVNSELPHPEESVQGVEGDAPEEEEADVEEGSQVDRQMTAAFRAFADE